jgi:enterochelin esterase-like enzyme
MQRKITSNRAIVQAPRSWSLIDLSNFSAARQLKLRLLTCAISLTAAAQSPPTVESPEVQPDRRITFRFRTPNAKKVVLQSEFAWSTPMLWLGCGKEDFVLRQSQQLHEMLRSKGVPHIYKETPGNHTFLVWRRYLAEFVPLLFRPN